MSSDLAGRVSGLLGLPFIPGNRVTSLKNGDAIFPKMLEAIRAAERHIEFCTFVYWTGPIATEVAMALCERAQSGVRVRVLLDGFGANKMRRRLVRKMRDAGVEVRWFRPLLSWRFWQIDNRTHRKILVCDGRVAFTGGVGVAEEWQGDARNPSEWRDTHFRIEGPAVGSIQAGFWNNWLEASGGLAADTLPVNPEVSRDIARPDDVPKVGGTRLLVMRSNATTRWSDVA
ncbi:MAG: phospholipase D-like domain-containing protein, partial [Pseudomonadota bacterium]